MKKRIISLLLALVMLFGVLPMTALAAGGEDVTQNVAEQGFNLVDWIKDKYDEAKDTWDGLNEELKDRFYYNDPSVCKGDHNAESYKVYVYVNATGYDANALKILKIDKDTVDGNGYFPVGEITLDGKFFNEKSQKAKTEGIALIENTTDWTTVKNELVKAGSLTKNMTGKYAANNQNLVDSYFAYAHEAYNITWGGRDTALFHWHFYPKNGGVNCTNTTAEPRHGNATSYGFENQDVHYHLDLHFTTTPVNIYAGNNGITQSEDSTYYDGAKLSGNVFITNMTIGPDDVTKPTGCPEGYTTDGKLYTDYECKNEWTADNTETLKENQPLTLYVKYVKETKYNVSIDKKYVNATTNDEIPNATLGNALSFTLAKSGASKQYTFEWDGTSQKYTCEENLPAGTYTITETGNTSIGEDWTFDSFSPSEITIPTPASEVAEQTTPAPVENFSFELTNKYTQVERKATSVQKSLVLDSTDENKGLPFAPAADITFPTKDAEGNVQPILVESGTVKLLYKITVTGDPKAAFTVTDADTELAYSANSAVTQDTTTKVYSGTLPETAGQDGKASLEFYVIKTFTNLTGSGKLENSVTLDNNTPVPTPDKVPYYTPITLPLSVKKSMTGDALPHGFNVPFTLNIVGSEKAAGANITAATANITVSNKENVDFKVGENALTSLGAAKEPGTYKYTLTEGTAPAHVSNDARLPITLTYTVTLSKDDDTGIYSLTYDLKYTTVGNEEFNLSGAQPTIFLSNTYTAPATSAAVKIKKTFEGLPEGAKYPNVSISLKNQSTNVVYDLVKAADSFTYTYSGIPAGTYSIIENNVNYDGYRQKDIHLKNGAKTIEIKESDYGTTVEFELVNVYEKIEKTPAKVNFSDLIQKEITIKGDYSFTGETFEAKLRYVTAKPYSLIPTEDTTYTLKATFDKHAKSGDTTDFVKTNGYDLEIEFPAKGTYTFWLKEVDEGESGVTYDESTYKLTVKIKEEGDKLVLDEIEYSKWNDGDLTGEADKNGYVTVSDPIVFENKINTGKKGDHIKIDSPNKLNTDDHYAYIIGYPDGTVQPNGEITRAEVATIFFRLLKDDVREKYFTKTNDFSDVNRSDWFNNPVSTMAELGIVKGYPDGTFRPNAPITRAEFAAIAARFDESSRYGETRFTDVAGHWAIREIAKAYNNGWIKGYPDNTFRPNRNITRAEAMTLINRVLNRAPETEKDLLSNMNKWSDNMDVDAWYYLAVQEATNSHDYRRKSSSYEHWIRMLEDPNWAKYER